MYQILVPTDFSDCASYATEAAIQIAMRTSGKIHLFHRLHIHPAWHKLSEQEKAEFPEHQQAVKEVEARFEELKRTYSFSNVTIESSYGSGDIVEQLSILEKKKDIDLVIMGSNGTSGFTGYLYGSNAQKIVRNSQCPVLVVKQAVDATSFKLKNLVFASDFKLSVQRSFEKFIHFASHFGANIHLVHIDLNPSDEGPDPMYKQRMEYYEQLCWRLPCFIHQYSDLGVEEGIIHFANESKADLVAIAHEEYGLGKILLNKGITEGLTKHLEIPLMSFRLEKEKSSANSI